jgi:hypothetical protein
VIGLNSGFQAEMPPSSPSKINVAGWPLGSTNAVANGLKTMPVGVAEGGVPGLGGRSAGVVGTVTIRLTGVPSGR